MNGVKNEFLVRTVNVDVEKGIVLFRDDFENFLEHYPNEPVFRSSFSNRRFVLFKGQIIVEESNTQGNHNKN